MSIKIIYVAGWLRESIYQLSDHFSILHYGHILYISKQENFWTPSTNMQSLYMYTIGKFSRTDFAIIISCNRC